jgi:hypothetical protein
VVRGGAGLRTTAAAWDDGGARDSDDADGGAWDDGGTRDGNGMGRRRRWRRCTGSDWTTAVAWLKVGNKVSTKLNDLLYSISLDDASFQPSTVTNIFL